MAFFFLQANVDEAKHSMDSAYWHRNKLFGETWYIKR